MRSHVLALLELSEGEGIFAAHRPSTCLSFSSELAVLRLEQIQQADTQMFPLHLPSVLRALQLRVDLKVELVIRLEQWVGLAPCRQQTQS